MKTKKEVCRSEQQAKAQLESILKMAKALEEAQKVDGFATYEGEEVTADDMIERITNDALDVEVRSGWYQPDGKTHKPEEYFILLCTGGPACRIIGDLSEYGEPETARIEHQDWGTYWTEYRIDSEQEMKVLDYARQFYFVA